MGVCPVCPVQPIEIPVDAEGTPCWQARRYLKQDIEPWVLQIERITSDLQLFSDLSKRCRAAAHGFLEHGGLPALVSWMESL